MMKATIPAVKILSAIYDGTSPTIWSWTTTGSVLDQIIENKKMKKDLAPVAIS